MEGPKVDRRDVGQGRAVNTKDTLVQEVGVSRLVEEALVTYSNKVVRVNRLDVLRDLRDTVCDSRDRSVTARRAGHDTSAFRSLS